MTVVVLDQCGLHEPREEVLTDEPVPEVLAWTIGRVWANRYPDDIVMLVEA